MITRHNVSIQMTEEEIQLLNELNKELSSRSIKEVNRTETVKYACKFTSSNLDVYDTIEKLKNELSCIKSENLLLKDLIMDLQKQTSKACKVINNNL